MSSETRQLLLAFAGLLVLTIGLCWSQCGSWYHVPMPRGSSVVEHRAHNPEVAGSNPAPANGRVRSAGGDER